MRKKMLPVSKNPHEILCMDCTFLLYLKRIDLPMNEYDICFSYQMKNGWLCVDTL